MIPLWIQEEATYSKLLSIFNSLFQIIYTNIPAQIIYVFVIEDM